MYDFNVKFINFSFLVYKHLKKILPSSRLLFCENHFFMVNFPNFYLELLTVTKWIRKKIKGMENVLFHSNIEKQESKYLA